ncbi:MAG: hypothetical protein LUE86_05755 [Clostridiales bacterium]|nr:hypothetical protein [Clostridiales bacterium]
MAQKQIFIKNADDFGLAINAATRMYRRTQGPEILAALCVTFDTLMAYMDDRTLIGMIRDFQPNSVETWGRGNKDDAGEPEKFFKLREELMIEYTNRKLTERTGQRMTSYSVAYIGQMMEAIGDGHHTGCFETSEKFVEWAKEHCRAGGESKWKESGNRIPVGEDYLPYFNLICLNMVLYSWRRQTYMPDTAASLIKANIGLIDEETAKRMIEASEDDEGNTCWIGMRKALREQFETDDR